MSTPILSSFSFYQFTDEELKAIGTSFSELQKQYIQNLISESAEELISLTYDEDKPIFSAQRQAYLRGQIDILKHLNNIQLTT